MPHAWPSAGGGDEGAGECPSLTRLITPSTLRHHLTPPGPRGHVTASLHTHVLTESRERTRPCPSHWSCAPGPGPRPPSSDPSANAVDSEAPSAQVGLSSHVTAAHIRAVQPTGRRTYPGTVTGVSATPCPLGGGARASRPQAPSCTRPSPPEQVVLTVGLRESRGWPWPHRLWARAPCWACQRACEQRYSLPLP